MIQTWRYARTSRARMTRFLAVLGCAAVSCLAMAGAIVLAMWTPW